VTKTRWLRKFDTSKFVRSEIPLDANEKPKPGFSLPVQGCNVELTEVQMAAQNRHSMCLQIRAEITASASSTRPGMEDFAKVSYVK
jgi:hypothetical protein